MIGWPLRLPKDLVIEMAKDVDLYVTVRRKAGEQRARAAFAELGIDPKHQATFAPSTTSQRCSSAACLFRQMM